MRTLELDVQITTDASAVVTHDRRVAATKCVDSNPDDLGGAFVSRRRVTGRRDSPPANDTVIAMADFTGVRRRPQVSSLFLAVAKIVRSQGVPQVQRQRLDKKALRHLARNQLENAVSPIFAISASDIQPLLGKVDNPSSRSAHCQNGRRIDIELLEGVMVGGVSVASLLPLLEQLREIDITSTSVFSVNLVELWRQEKAYRYDVLVDVPF